jgi:hypothetical protein
MSKDLVVLVADKNMQFALRGAFGRPRALGTGAFDHEFRIHVGRDGGVRASGAAMLAQERRRFRHALLVLDFEGCGADAFQSPQSLQAKLDSEMRTHWGEDGRAIVISPELDVWLWGSNNALHEVLDWPIADTHIRDWLIQRGFQFGLNGKPLRPKEALEALVPIHRKPRSSALYEQITHKISLRSCKDPAFLRLRETLIDWFPREAI